ncbi:MAG: hypothetical protein A2418_01540 [Candidatus Brennerbacteria bacterium RIFOXYC1_FULL_41_11]|uniref:Uncharacterized protein n=1 Tax=Candidatus Brennerbacteria bacterium RIFOXYD1_FULL_41_16 TaxID=1797529 RepID=A0A1G1XJ57_9BACT|nr:MAG: hypothetical protein A2418_01540 [Candidatus Brennerbacteria bacterium RIFOXYC1_FULL_41_11]OGY39365.1 MAG: hypothetical protein A2391_02735 [Candidatus Brennerbacteria bacterium RIFOXYB1_FULL_41_13]OGY39992.1 MAG: hypothetical protein A2570_00685 [Candidatus Brennerbacteria bacterium RIFOXYD1_FULL_41_16]
MAFFKRLFLDKKTVFIILIVLIAGVGYFLFHEFFQRGRVLAVSEVPGYEFSIKNRKALDRFLKEFGFWEFRWNAGNKENIKRLRVVFTDKPQDLMAEVSDDGKTRSSYGYSLSQDGLVLNLFAQTVIDSNTDIEKIGGEAQYWLMRMVYDTYLKETGLVVDDQDAVFFEEKDFFGLFSDQKRFFELERSI